MEEGIEKGIQKGQNETAGLMGYLALNGRTDDIIKASTDKAYLQKMILAYNAGTLV